MPFLLQQRLFLYFVRRPKVEQAKGELSYRVECSAAAVVQLLPYKVLSRL